MKTRLLLTNGDGGKPQIIGEGGNGKLRLGDVVGLEQSKKETR